jgi:hypothetical protein
MKIERDKQMSIETIEIDDLSELPKYESYIRENCDNIKDVFTSGIYFINELDHESCGLQISFSTYPTKMSINNQAMILKAINAACNTNFVLRGT